MVSVLSSNVNTYNAEIDAILARLDAHRKELTHEPSEERTPTTTQPTQPIDHSIGDSPMEISIETSVNSSVESSVNGSVDTAAKPSDGSTSNDRSAEHSEEPSQTNVRLAVQSNTQTSDQSDDQTNDRLLTPEEIERIYGRQALKDYYHQIADYLMSQ